MRKLLFLLGACFCLLSVHADNDYKYFVDLNKVDDLSLRRQ